MTRYVITDPSYVLTDDQIADGEYFSFDTKYGDGEYFDTAGNRYFVDSGRLACIEVDTVTEVERLNEMMGLGMAHIFEMEDLLAFDCSDDDGVITFGTVVIDTN
jgi:hypothetical protein